jgi:N-acetylmuramoyl-L-alanine amidase
MLAIIQYLLYDLPYFLYKTADNFKWDGLIIFTVYQLGRISGMRLFRNHLERHFPYFQSEEVQFKAWTIKQVVKLGGDPFLPQKEYRGAGRSKKSVLKNFDSSSTKLQGAIAPERRYPMKKAIIDGGHGKKDPGGNGYTGKLEKDFNLAVALKINEILKKNPEIDVILTRSTDVFVELVDRAKIANKAKADVFLSIHANAGEPSAKGSETLYTKDMDKPFATIIHKYLMSVTGLTDRKCRYQNLSVCRNTTMPACLIEPGFLTNPAEEELLFNEEFQNKLAVAMAQGICEYLGVKYGVRSTPAGTYPVDVLLNDVPYEGLLIEGKSWVPAKLILNALGARWSYALRSIYVGDTKVDTKIYDGTSYIKGTDLRDLGVVRGVFLDPDAINTKRVLIYPKESVTNE